MKKRLLSQGRPGALWHKTTGRAGALLVALLLWLTAAQAMAELINGVAVYDKTTGVLTFDSWDAVDEWPEAKENQELYYLWNPAENERWFESMEDGYSDRFNWSETTRQATRVVIKEEFQKYKTLPTCRAMFKNFENLKTIEGLEYLIPNNETVTDMSYMFADCKQLQSVEFNDVFKTENIKNMSYMFYDCYALEELDLSNWRSYMVEDMSYMFANCEQLSRLNTKGLYMQCVKDMSRMFSNCKRLPSVKLNVNAGDLINMQYMFSGCSSLTEVDLTRLANIHNVKKMNNLFEYCSQLKQVNMSRLDASKVTDMNCMFAYCEQLESIDMTGFRTRDVQDLSNMFLLCRNLKRLDLSGFNTDKVENMGGMFSFCESLTELNLSRFNTARVTNMAHLFNSCRALSTLDVSGFNTSRVTTMVQMFFGCKALTALDLSKFNTSEVTDMSSMFTMSDALTTLDLSSFNTSRVTDMSSMFAYCTALRDIYVGDGFTTAAAVAEDFPPMFSNCTSLPGFDKNERGKTRAHYGDGGYLLKLVGRVGGRKIGARGDQLTADKVTMADGEDLEVYSPFTAKELIYTRQMDDRQWQAAYLPFPVTAEGLPEGYRAAAIIDFHEYDQADGTCHVELEAQQIADGERIEALTPLLLRRVQDGVEPLTMRTEGAELSTDFVRTSSCASVERLYTFLGTMQSTTIPGGPGIYFMQDGDLAQVPPTYQMPAGRWCMVAENRSGGSLTQALPDHISVNVAGDATAISSATAAREDSAAIYDLQGRRLQQEPLHGVYIKNGRKYVK